MHVKINNYSVCCKRFDFGVPLEDIFPSNDIHPRLKYLFEEAYHLSVHSPQDIEFILRHCQGSLEERLRLKDMILYDLYYKKYMYSPPGTYFWLIRHFLGLLPIPLLPTYTDDIKFEWEHLSIECRHFLENYRHKQRNCRLDYLIAENLNFLPFQHFMLLNFLMVFLRKVSQKSPNNRQIQKRYLSCLARYYSSAIFMRPYIPGFNEDVIFALLVYILLRWKYIQELCGKFGNPGFHLESSKSCVKDSWDQRTNFESEILTIYRNVPYSCKNDNFSRDIECQTDMVSVSEKGVQSYEESNKENYSMKQIIPIANSTILLDDSTEVEFKHSKNVTNYPELTYVTAADYNTDEAKLNPFCESRSGIREGTFFTTADSSKEEDWNEVIKETTNTVNKVEGYIYDDYETFKNEDYNQVAGNPVVENNSTIFDKVSKIGWTYTPPDASSSYAVINVEELHGQSYVKFDDICDKAENKVKETLDIVFQTSNDSIQKKHLGKEESRNKSNFNLKRFKINLDFLRVLAPNRNVQQKLAHSCKSNVKYKKIKNFKANTL